MTERDRERSQRDRERKLGTNIGSLLPDSRCKVREQPRSPAAVVCTFKPQAQIKPPYSHQLPLSEIFITATRKEKEKNEAKHSILPVNGPR